MSRGANITFSKVKQVNRFFETKVQTLSKVKNNVSCLKKSEFTFILKISHWDGNSGLCDTNRNIFIIYMSRHCQLLGPVANNFPLFVWNQSIQNMKQPISNLLFPFYCMISSGCARLIASLVNQHREGVGKN